MADTQSPLPYHSEAVSSFTDCRSEVGITVGLIDGLIAIGRILRQRELSHPEVAEALKDLAGDEDIDFLLAIGKQALP